MPRRPLLAVATIATLAVGGACSGAEVHEASNDLPPTVEREAGSPEIQTTGPPPVERANYLTDTGAAEAAIADIVGKLGPVLVTSVDLYDTYVIFEAQDLANPENLDRYTYREGEITESDPVRVNQQLLDALPERLFALTDVSWAAVPALTASALAQLPVENGEVNHLGADRVRDGEIRLSLSVSGPRRSGHVTSSAEGIIIEANLL